MWAGRRASHRQREGEFFEIRGGGLGGGHVDGNIKIERTFVGQCNYMLGGGRIIVLEKLSWKCWPTVQKVLSFHYYYIIIIGMLESLIDGAMIDLHRGQTSPKKVLFPHVYIYAIAFILLIHIISDTMLCRSMVLHYLPRIIGIWVSLLLNAICLEITDFYRQGSSHHKWKNYESQYWKSTPPQRDYYY